MIRCCWSRASSHARARRQHVTSSPPATDARGARTLTIIGTNDLHGALDRLPLLAGFIANVRAARAADGGGVLLLDGGDMFQGTLESNLAEGADVVSAYNAIGYDAVAIGNHEFDFGPEGPGVTAKAGRRRSARRAQGARRARRSFRSSCPNIDRRDRAASASSGRTCRRRCCSRSRA